MASKVEYPRNPVSGDLTHSNTNEIQSSSEGKDAAPARKAGSEKAPESKRRAPRKAAKKDIPAEMTVTKAEDEAAKPVAKNQPEVSTGVAPVAEMTGTMMANLETAEALIKRLAAALSMRRPSNPQVEGPSMGFYAGASQAWMKMLTESPGRIIEQQAQFWTETIKHYAAAQAALIEGKMEAPPEETPITDKRFKHPLWQSHPYFNFIRRQYEITSSMMRRVTGDMPIEDPVERQRLDWFTGQLIDMLSPTNFLGTNPDALEKAVETEGESLVRGLQNLVNDVENHAGDLVVTLADRNAFKVGENIATAPGRIVAKRPLYEMIQFSPTTEQVHQTPIILFPPWINKFYILDLKPQNSFIRWVVDQGFTLFVMSWKNPGPDMADTGLDDYVQAYLDAMENVRAITGEKKVNAVGYCIGGTTLSLALGALNKKGLGDTVESATFFTTLTDFSDLGEFTPFLQDDFIQGIQTEVQRNGVLSAALMSRTFSFLRSNDLVWGPAIRSYMMGETPPAFDLLYWNGDSTNLPGRMAVDYLTGLCRDNLMATTGYEVQGHKITLSDITQPVCSIACQTDHIAPWKHCWNGLSQFGSKDKTFIMAESGHIAGIVNPPNRVKYGYHLSEAGFDKDHDHWLASAVRKDGSWWPVWKDWIAPRSGEMVPARHPDEGIGPSPGVYVTEGAFQKV